MCEGSVVRFTYDDEIRDERRIDVCLWFIDEDAILTQFVSDHREIRFVRLEKRRAPRPVDVERRHLVPAGGAASVVPFEPVEQQRQDVLSASGQLDVGRVNLPV